MKNMNTCKDKEYSRKVLDAAFNAWKAAAQLRQRRLRYKRYTYGQQWDDPATDADGNIVTEGDLATVSGKRPYTNNLIRRLVKSIVGHFRNNLNDSDIADNLTGFYHKNLISELDSRLLEEFLISGCAIQRLSYERRATGEAIWAENINPSRFFVNAFQDPRAWDIELIGSLHDMSIAEIIMRFSHGDRRKARSLQRTYQEIQADIAARQPLLLGRTHNDDIDFFKAPQGRCRVIEVWTLESREILKCHDRKTGQFYTIPLYGDRTKQERKTPEHVTAHWGIETYWQCRYLAPDGTLLDSGKSPYSHGSHPFVVKFYPLTDGEVHPFVEDVIDQQRYINRLITLIDHIMSVSAKGVLLFPARQKPANMTWEEVGKAWATCDRIIPYEPLSGDAHKPQQIVANNSNHDAHRLLSIEMDMLNEVAGISDAFLGKFPTGNTSAALYETQTRNAAITLIDIFDCFKSFRQERDHKAITSKTHTH